MLGKVFTIPIENSGEEDLFVSLINLVGLRRIDKLAGLSFQLFFQSCGLKGLSREGGTASRGAIEGEMKSGIREAFADDSVLESIKMDVFISDDEALSDKKYTFFNEREGGRGLHFEDRGDGVMLTDATNDSDVVSIEPVSKSFFLGSETFWMRIWRKFGKLSIDTY